MKKILIVCKGNICRSPIAEGLLRKKCQEKGITNVKIDSAGTGHWHIGKSPDPRAIEVAQKNDLDITSLKGRQFQYMDFNEFDEIYTMDDQNYNHLHQLSIEEEEMLKVTPITFYSPDSEENVGDPYHFDSNYFDLVYKKLDQITSNMVESWK